MGKDSNSKISWFINYLKSIYQINGKTFLKEDILAGITVALIIIPQSMAYASIAWLPIEVGLYTSFVWVLIWWLLGSSKQMSTGPVTIVSLMTAAALYSMWIEADNVRIVYASILALSTWIFYLLLVILRLWIIVEFLSHPVVVWFTNAIAIVTITSQMSKIFWISVDKWLNYFEWIYAIIIKAINETHLITFAFWFLWISLLILLKKYFPKVPRILILLIISILVSKWIWYQDVFDGKVVWTIIDTANWSWLPIFSIPFLSEVFNTKDFITIIWFGFIIWLIGFTESISVAKWVAARTKQKVSTNKELLSQSIANIGSWLFWWYWVAWSFSRTAVNLRAGARTWLASIVTWIIVWITIMYLTPFLFHLPTAILAAIIIVAVAWLIKIEPIIDAWKIEKSDAYIAIITFMWTIFFTPNVEKAIWIWVIISLAMYIYKSMKPKIVEVSMYKNWVYRDAKFFKLKRSKWVCVIRIDRWLPMVCRE